MSLPIFDQINAGLQLSYSSFLPVYFMLIIVGILLLANAGWTMPMALILFSGVILMTAWASYATYGLLGLAVLITAYILVTFLFALIRR